VTDPTGRTCDHGYDANGNRESLAYPNTVATTYAYDNLNRLTNLTTQTSSAHIQSYDFTLGPAATAPRSSSTRACRRNARSTTATTTSTASRARRSTSWLDLPRPSLSKAFKYDAVGNRETQTTTLGPAAPSTLTAGHHQLRLRHSRSADSRGRAKPTAGMTNGNLTFKDAEATYVWDHENRLLKVLKADGTIVDHVYDADGNRVQTTTTPWGGPAQTVDSSSTPLAVSRMSSPRRNAAGALLATTSAATIC